MAQRRKRTQVCGAVQAQQRLAHARRSRSDNHHDAEALLQQIAPEGKQAAGRLRQLIDVKDAAHYGFISVTTPQLKRSLRQAQRLVEFAESVRRRSGAAPVGKK